MLKKTLLIALLLAPLTARADGMDATTFNEQQRNGSANAGSSKLSDKDLQFLSQMPSSDFPGGRPGTSNVADGKIANPFQAGDAEENEKVIKYIYNGNSQFHMRRIIKDDRIDDGYVQGLLQQNGQFDQ